MGGGMEGWMKGWMDEWVDGGVDGWMKGWVDGCMGIQCHSPLRSPLSPGVAELECGLSRGELEAIREWLLEEKEDEEGAREER